MPAKRPASMLGIIKFLFYSLIPCKGKGLSVLHGFRRILTGKQYIPQIDGLRFVAIFSVLLFHLHGSLVYGGGAVRSPFASSGPLFEVLSKRGVELFFAISGFILALPFASSYLKGRPRVRLRAYFLRRLTRLEPPYLVNLIVICLLGVVVWHTRPESMLPHFVASALYLHNIIYQTPSVLNAAAWSLEVEIQFYVSVPLLTWVFRFRETRLRRVWIAAGMLITGVASLPLVETPWQNSLLYYLNFFLAGFLLCDLYLFRGDAWDTKSFKWDWLALCGWPLIWMPNSPWAHVLLPYVITLLYVAAFRGVVCSAVFSNRWIATIGGMCYSIYLFQFLGFGIMGRFTKPIHFGNNFAVYYLLQAAMILPGILAISTFFYLLIERPCMDKDWPGKLWHRVRRQEILYNDRCKEAG